jgi:YD repeat-containing protein
MAIVIGGHETGLLDGSLTMLNRGDRTAAGDPGGGEQLYVNVASGNLTVQNRDVYMPSLGDDYELIRTYNSRPVPAYEVRLSDNPWARTYNVFIMDKTINGQKTYEVTYADGSTLLFRWDATINAYKTIDGDGAFERMVELTQSGTEWTPFYEVTRADQSRMIFSKHGRLLEWVDTNGVRTEFSYNAQLHLSRVRDDQGHIVDYNYTNNRVTSVVHNVYGTLVQYTYNATGRLASVTDRNGHITRYFYNTDGYLNRIELPDRQTVNGQLQTFAARVYQFEYKAPPIDWTGSGSKQLLMRITGPDGTYTTFDYTHDVGNNGTQPDPNKRPEDQWFRGGSTKVVDALGNARARSNDAQYVQWRLANGYYQTYTASREIPANPWDPIPDPAFKAQVDAIRNAHSMVYEFDADSYITAVTDQQGYKTQYTYDTQNNVTSVTDGNGWGATRSDSTYFRKLRADLGYVDSAGNGKLVASLTTAEVNAIKEAFTTHYEYDIRGNRTKQTDNADNITTWTYTTFNKVATTTSAVGQALTTSNTQYYQDKRVALGYAPLAANLTAANKTALLDLHTTTFLYDSRQNLIERRDPGGDLTRYEYDSFGNNTRRIVFLDSTNLVDPEKQQITQYKYDAFGNVVQVIDAEGKKSENQYDPFGNLIRTIDTKGAATLYTYDNDNRLISTTTAQGNNTVFAYDAVGNRIGVTDALGHTITSLFDVHNNLLTTLDPSLAGAAQNRQTQHSYDVVGNRTSMLDAEGRRTDYEFNTRRELIKTITATVTGADGVTPVRYQSTLGYDGVGNRVTTTDNRGFTTEFLYTQNHLIRQQTDAIGQVTRYTYDANNNEIQIVAGLQLEAAKRQIHKFSFDEEDQTISQVDAMGHLTSQAYDAVGNTVSVTDANGNTTNFIFDKNNRRILQIHPTVIHPVTGDPVRYVSETRYDGNGNVIEEIDENGNSTKYTFDRDNRLVVTQDAKGTKTIFQYDSRNNRTSVIIDGDATVQPVSVNESFSEQISYENFENGWGGYLPAGEDAIIYSGNVYAFEGNNAANIRDNSGSVSSFVSAPNGLVPAPSPVPSATYSASAVGTAGCTGSANCTLESWGVDLNEGSGFRWTVNGGTGGQAQLYVKVAAATSTRSMSLWVNNVRVGTITANPNEAPRPVGKEYGPLVVQLGAGNNTVELRDTEGQGEFDAHSVRLVGLPATATPPNDIPNATYSAATVGTAGCTGTAACTLQSWGIDLNEGAGFRWTVNGGPGSGGQAQLFLKVASASGNRSMSLWVNNVRVGTVTANSTQAPRPTGFEYGPFLVNLTGGNNTVEVRDTEGSTELDIHNVRVVAVPNQGPPPGQTGQGSAAPGYDFTRYSQVNLNFAFYAEHLTAGESFFVEYSSDGGNQWSTVKRYINGTDFNNFLFVEKALTLTSSQYTFSNNVKFRFRSDTQDDARDIYVDHIKLNGTGTRTRTYENIVVAAPKDVSVIQRYTYNEFNELVAYTDGMGNALLESNSVFYQDERQRLGFARNTASLTAANRTAIKALYTATSAYDRVGNLTQTKDNEGRITSFNYDALNRQVQITDAKAGITKARYDGNSNRVELIDANNHSTKFTFDAVNRLTDTLDALNTTDRNIYDSFGNLLAITRALATIDERTTRFEYDLDNRLTRLLKPELNDERYQYDAVGNRIRVIDGRSNATDYQYDAMNRNIKIIDPLLFETRYEYDGVSNRLTTIDARGGIQRMQYDPLNNLVKLTDAEQRVTTYSYDLRSNRIEMRTAFGVAGQEEVTRFEYDAENNLRKVTDAEGGITFNGFDRVYNQTFVKDANGNQTTSEFDALNRQVKITDALGGITRIDYDAVGNRLKVTDALLNATEFTYDAINQLIQEKDARGVITEYRYDKVDNRVSIKRAANTTDAAETVFQYDRNDRLKKQTDAEGNITEYFYDANDKQIQVKDARGNSTFYTYDAKNQVIEIKDPENNLTKYTYDGNGNRTTVTDARNNVSVNYYNANNEIKTRVDAEGYATRYEYDFNGNLVRETLHMVPLALPLNPAQEPTLPSSPLNQIVTYDYDLLNRLVERVDGEGYKTLLTYDAVGNRLTETQYRKLDGSDNAVRRSFYDNLYREVATVTAERYLHKQTYDAVGNLLTKTIFDQRVTIPANGSAPVPVAGDIGRTTAFAYDKVYRTTRETSALGILTDYEYDERGNREAVIKAATTTEAQRTSFVYDRADRLVETVDALGTRTHRTLDGNGNVTLLQEAFGISGEVRSTIYAYDGNNRQEQMTDAKGTITQTIYDGNGNVTSILRAVGLPEAREETFVYDKNNRLKAQENGERERTEYDYDGAGNRTALRAGYDSNDPARNSVRQTLYTYDKDNRLTLERDALGVETQYQYDGADNNTVKIEALGLTSTGEQRRHEMVYDLDNRLTSRKDPLGFVTTYSHDVLGNITVITDARNNQVTNTYDAIGRLLSSRSDEGVVTAHTYDRRDNLVTKTTYLLDGASQTDQRVTKFQYDLLDRLTRKDDPEAFSRVMTYDVFGNKLTEQSGLYLVLTTDPNYSAAKAALAQTIQSATYDYDVLDRLEKKIDGEGRDIRYTYDAHGNRLTEVDDATASLINRRTIYQYDKADRAIEINSPEGGRTRNTYNTHGEVLKTEQLQSVDGSTEVLINNTFSYDDLGRLTAKVDGELARTEFEYDAVGNQKLVRYGAGTASTYTNRDDYDLNNRVIAKYDGLNHKTQLDYDAVGNLIKKTDPRNNTAFYYYDGDNRQVATVNEEKYLQKSTYDSLGNVTAEQYFANKVTGSVTPAAIPTVTTSILDRTSQFFFDGNGQLEKEIEASGAERIYLLDSLGNISVETDALGHQTKYTYDTECRVKSVETADGTRTTYIYDLVGNNTRITSAAGTAEEAVQVMGYDFANRLVSQKDFLDLNLTGSNYLETRFTYDRVGNKVSKTDAENNTATWKYDLNNREESAIDPYLENIDTSYDAFGNVVQVTDAMGGVTTNYFDANNRIVISVDAEGWVKSFTYDQNGNLKTERRHMAAPLSAVPSPSSRPSLVNSAADQVVTYELDALNRKTAQIDGEGYRSEYVLDAFSNQTLIRQQVNQPAAGSGDPITWAQTYRYYDKVDQLTHEVSAEKYLTFNVYDLVGNIREKNQYKDKVTVPADGSAPTGNASGRILYQYRYDAVDRLQEEESPLGVITRYNYDRRGNQVEIVKAYGVAGVASATGFTFDKANRLTDTTYADGTVTHLELDDNGNIIKEHMAYGTADARVTEFEYDANNRVEKKTLAANDASLAVTTFFGRDANGNVIHQEEAFETAENRITQFEYDKNNRATAEIRRVNNPDNLAEVRVERSELSFDGAGNQILKIVAVGTGAGQRITSSEYDLDNRLKAENVGLIESPANVFTGGTRTEYFYDGMDSKVRTVQAVDVAGEERTSLYTYDLEGKLTSIADPMSGLTTYEYDVHGNQKVIVDANGNERRNYYDNLGRVVRSEFGNTLVTNTYDVRGNITKATQSKLDGVSELRQTYYGYDLLDQKRWIVDPEGFASTLEYDLVGNQTKVTTGLYMPGLIGAANDADKAALAVGRASATRFDFDKLNRQAFMITAEGTVDENVRQFAYDMVGNKIGETEAFGDAERQNTIVYQYDKANRLVQTNDPEGSITLIRYNEAGEKILQRMLQQDGAEAGESGQIWIEHKFEYDAYGRLRYKKENLDLAAASANEKLTTEYQYDALGNQRKVIVGVNLDPTLWRTTEMTYDYNNRVTTEIDATLGTKSYDYDALGNRTLVTDARGNSAHYYFDAQGNTVKILDGNGYINEFIYDSSNNRIGEKVYSRHFDGVAPAPEDADDLTVNSHSDDRSSSSTYYLHNKLKSRTDADGSYHEYFYDASGNLIREERYLNTEDGEAAAPLILHYKYDLQNRVSEFTDVNDTVTKTFYDASNNKKTVEITESTGLSAADIAELEDLGITGLTPTRTSVTNYEYDLSNREIRQTFDPAGLNIVQSITYDEMGHAIAKSNGNGAKESFSYDRLGHITSQQDAVGNLTKFGIDQFGDQRSVENPRAFDGIDDGLTHIATFEYDAMGRVLVEKQPPVTIYTLEGGFIPDAEPTTTHAYDAAGNEIQTTDANGNKTSRYFDANNNLIAEVNGDNVLTKWTYNAFGEKTSQTLYMIPLESLVHDDLENVPVGDGSNVQTIYYAYDQMGRLSDTTYPDVTYVKEGIDLTDPDVVFPPLNVGEQIVTEDLHEIRTYDKYGQVEKLTDRRGGATYTWYDASGQLLAQVDPANYATTFVYDGQGNVTKQSTYTRALPADFATGDRPTYSELLAELDAVDASEIQVVTRVYDSASRMTHEVAPEIAIFNAIDLSDSALKALTEISVENARIVTEFGYDKVGNEITKTLVAGNSDRATTEYSYFDAANRRIALVDGARGLSTFEYDANGNRTRITRFFEQVDANQDLADLYGNEDYTTAGDFAALVESHAQDQIIENTFNVLNQEETRIERMSAGDSSDDLTERYFYDGMNQKTFSQSAMTDSEYAANDQSFITAFEFNARGKVTRIQSADGSIKHSEYDAAGNLVKAFTGTVAPPSSFATVNDVNVVAEGLEVKWNFVETGIQTYLVYGGSSIDINPDNVTAEQLTKLGYEYLALPGGNISDPNVTDFSAVIDDSHFNSGDEVYFRVIAQTSGGSLSWSEEETVTVPVRLSNIEVTQSDQGVVSVIASFNGSPSSAPNLTFSGSGSVNRTSLGNNTYRFELSGDTSLQADSYEIEWESADQTFSTDSISFEAEGRHYGVSTGLNEIRPNIGGTVAYRIEGRTVIKDDGQLETLTVSWFGEDSGVSGELNIDINGSNPNVIDDGDRLIINYVIGQNTALENEEYRIVIRGIYDDGTASVLDFIDVTPGEGSEFNITQNGLSVQSQADGDRHVFVNGERVGSSRQTNSDGSTNNIIFNANNLVGTNDRYSILYGDEYGSDHEVSLTTTDDDEVGVQIDFAASEFNRIDNDEVWIAYKDTSSIGLYTNVTAMEADAGDNTYAVALAGLTADDEKDFKIYYFSGGKEVVVELFRYALGGSDQSITEKSMDLVAAEYDGTISVSDAASDPVDPDDPDSEPLYPDTKRISVEEGLLVGAVTDYDINGAALTHSTSNAETGSAEANGISVGYFTVNHYNSINSRIATNDQTGNWRTFDVDANGNAIRTLDYGESRIVDEELQPVFDVDPLQNFKVYDGRNRVIMEYSPLVRTDNSGNVIEERGPQVTYEYNALDKVVAQTDAADSVTEKEYDLAGNLITEIQAAGTGDERIKRFYYDERGNETAVVSESTIVLVDEDGQPASDVIDHLQIKTYDALSNLTREVGGEVDLKTLNYDTFNRIEKEILSSETHMDYTYDHRNRLLTQVDAEDHKTEFKYDGRDNRTITIDANSKTFEQKWDQLGQAVKEIAPGGSDDISKRKEYDAYGNTIAEYDEEGRVTRSIYGAFSQLKQTVDQGGRVTVYAYDAWGRLESETGGNGATKEVQRVYDSLGRLTKIIDSGTGVSTYYEYDLAGRREREIVSDGSTVVRDITYDYDQHGQMTRWEDSAAASKGEHLNYEWYKNGNLYRAYTDNGWDPLADDPQNSGGTSKYLDHVYYYDRNNRVTKISNNGADYKRYKYNEAGNREWALETTTKDDVGYSQGDKDSGQTIAHEYTYYQNGWVHTATWTSGGDEYEATWDYDNVGNVKTYTILNLDSTESDKTVQKNTTEYDDNYRVTKTINKSRDEDNKLSTQTTENKVVDNSGRILESTLTSQVAGEDANTYTYKYEFTTDGREARVTALGKASGGSTTTYDSNDNKIKVDKGQADGDKRNEILTFGLNNDNQIIHRDHQDGDNKDYKADYYYANGNPVGEIGDDEDGQFAYFDTGKYSLVQKLDSGFPTPTVSSYSVRRGDTLQSIAGTLYGNSSLWFVIADANGLNSSEELKEGARLSVPSTVQSGRLTADAHVNYSEGSIVGSTLPNLKSPPPKKKDGCVQILVIILVVIVAVVAAVFTAGIGGAIVGAAGAGLLATLGALALAGLVGAAIALAANAITQGIYIAFGMQKEFDWNAFAFAGAAGFISGVAGGLGAAAQAAGKASELATYAKVALPLLRMGAAAVQQLGTDGDGDGKPDWKITSWVGLAAAGAGGLFEGLSIDSSAAQGAAKSASIASTPAEALTSGGTIGTIQKVIEYATPWAELAESYIRYETGDNKDQPFDWLSGVASAVASNLISAVESPLQKSQGGDKQVFSNRLGVALVNTTINAFTAGVMSAIDPEKGEAFLISSVGNEVGQFVGGVLTIEGRFQEAANWTGNKLADAVYGDRDAAAAAGQAAGAAAGEASRNARKGQSQQEAAVTEESQSEQVAGYVSSSEAPQESVESAAGEPQVPTITNKDGEQVPLGMATVEAKGKSGTVLPWNYAKQLADARAMELRGKPATNAEINLQYRLLVELNGEEINFNRPLENGTVLKTVAFDSGVEISPETTHFVVAQDKEYRRQKALIEERKQREQMKAQIISAIADSLGVSKDAIGNGSGSPTNVTADVQELQSLLHGSLMAGVFTEDEHGAPTVSQHGLDQLNKAGMNLEGVTFAVKADDQGNITAGIIKNGSVISLGLGNDDAVDLTVYAGNGDLTLASRSRYGAYNEVTSGVEPIAADQYLFSNDPSSIQNNPEAPRVLAAGMGPSLEQLQALGGVLGDPAVQEYGANAAAGVWQAGVRGNAAALWETAPPPTSAQQAQARAEYRSSRLGQATQYRGLSNAQKGIAGESAGRAGYLRQGYTEMPARLPSNNGIDGVFVQRARSGRILDIVVNESKYAGDGAARLSNTRTMGQQLSPQWIDANIQKMRREPLGSGERAAGDFLNDNRNMTRSQTNTLNREGVNKWNDIPNTPNVAPNFGADNARVRADAARAAKIGKVAGVVGKVGLGVGVAVDTYGLGTEVYESSQTGNWHNTGKKATEIAGGWGGAWAGGKVGGAAGAWAGGAIGSFVPVIGTATGAAVGGIIGGLVGGALGYWGGSSLAGAGYENATGYNK